MAVIIYTTPSCAYCRVAKNWFRQNKVTFTEYDIASDDRRAEEMLRKSGQTSVPVIDVNGRIVVGFNQPEIERALKR